MNSPRVLIVDDSQRSRERLVQIARSIGCVVTVAGDGEAGLDACRAESFNLILLDVHLPVLDAFGFLPALRKLPGFNDVPVIVVTSDPSRHTRIRLLEAGADDFMLKPVDPAETEHRLRRLLVKSELVQSLDQVTSELLAAREELTVRNAELERLTLGLVTALEGANVLNDTDTGNHIRRVRSYASLLARAQGSEPAGADQIFRYAGLHDVGKVGIRDAILKKPGRLTAAEFEEMKGHTVIGADLLRAARLPTVAVNIALGHHERWDGSGYPCGLAGEAIPLEARIVAIVDVFDALVNRRCYKGPLEVEESVRMLRDAAGSQFDPRLVVHFCEEMPAVLAIRAEYSDEPLDLAGWG